MNRKRKRRPATEPTRPEYCGECRRVTTTPGGICVPCVLRLRAEEAARTNPPPPEPPPKQEVIQAPGGCFKCGTPGGRLCAGCDAELHGIPRREGDPVIKYPRPCCRITGR